MTGFDSPYILTFLLIIPLIYYLYKKARIRKKNEAIKFSNLAFIKSALGDTKKSKRDVHLFYMSLAAIGLIIIGFANPHIPLEQTKEGENIVLVMDVSGSMQAQDYAPSRLEAAKSSAEILINSLKSKDYVGIVTFESVATTAAYLCPDKEKVIEKLHNIAPTEGGTAIGDGLSLGIVMASSVPNKKKVVILLSDGVNNAGYISPEEAVQYAKANNIQIYTISIGSNSHILLGYDLSGNPQYAKLDESMLQAVAYDTGGKYFKSVDEKTLDEIYRYISEEIKRENEETNIKDWFFFAALLTLLVQIYYRYGKGRILQ